MAEFCKCGSIMINNQCTNKNCASRSAGKSAGPAKKVSAGAKSKESPKNPRRASKVITYNLYDDESQKPE